MTAADTALAQVRAICGWHVAPSKTETITVDGSGGGMLLLPSLHVTDVQTITEDGDELDSADYQWSTAGVVRRVRTETWLKWGPHWTDSLRGVEVTFTHGYTTMPADLQQVVDNLATRITTGSTLLQSVTRGPFSETYADPASTGIDAAVLSFYRLPSLP